MTRATIIGCGYIGRRVAAACRDNGQRVRGLLRSDEGVNALRDAGIEVIQADLDAEQTLADLICLNDDLYYFAPPPPHGQTDTRIEHLLLQLNRTGLPRRIVYISTSGVYGDCGGAWIDEQQPLKPQTPRGQRRYAAEQSLLEWSADTGVAVVILRVPGIYGPGKLPLERLRKQLPLLREADSPYTNRIHADDLVQACLAAMQQGVAGEAYNVADGHPSNMTDYFNHIADHAGLPRPPTVTRAEAEQKLSAGMRSFMDESKRLDNRKLREELGVELRFPDLDSGLADCFARQGEPG